MRYLLRKGLAIAQVGALGLAGLFSLLFIQPAQAGVNEWTPASPGVGQVRSIAISPNYASDDTLFATTVGGLYRSTDDAASWELVKTGSANGVQVSPNYASDQTAFIFGGTSLHKSTDGGDTWSTITLPFSMNGFQNSFAISPNYASDSTLLAACGTSSNGGLWKSTDGGANWSQVSVNGNYTRASVAAFSPAYASDQTIFTGTNDSSGGDFYIYRSTNGGANWTNVTDINSVVRPTAMALSPNFASDQTVFAGNQGLYKTTNKGASWSAVSGALVASSTLGAIAISPNFTSDSTIFLATSIGIRRSTDGGANWSTVTSLSAVHGAVAFSPNYASDDTVFAGNTTGSGTTPLYQTGFWKSTDNGDTWTKSNTGIHNYATDDIAVSPNFANDQTIFMNLQHTVSGAIYRSTDGGATWTLLPLGVDTQVNDITLSPNYASDDTVFVGTSGSSTQSQNGVWKSTDNGDTWTQLTSIYQVGSIAISPNYASDNTLFIGTNTIDYGNYYGVFRSTDGGSNWTRNSTGLGGNRTINDLVVSPNYASDTTLYTSVSGAGVYKLTSWGGSWSQVYGTAATSLAISPSYASDDTLFAGLTGSGGVCRSEDEGGNWSCAQSGKVPTGLAVSSNYAADQTIFMVGNGTVGVWKSIDKGDSWTDVSGNLPTKEIRSIALVPNYAALHQVFLGANQYGVYKGELD